MGAPTDSSPILDWEESALRKGAGDAWGEWLADGWDWEWFATLTFADPKDQGTHTSVGWALSDRLYREWIGRLDERVRMAGHPGAYWVRAREPHQLRRSTHFHALVGGVGNLSRRDAWSEWFGANGQARIEPVNTKGATYYVAKYVNKAGGELIFSDNAGLHMKESSRNDSGYGGDAPSEWVFGRG